MAIEIYHLPPGTGKFREKLLNESIKGVKAFDYSKILHLAPTGHIVKGFRDAFHSATGGCYIPPRSMTLKQFSKQVYRAHGEKALIPGAFIPVVIAGIADCGMGLATLVAEFITELKHQFPSSTPQSIRETLLDAFGEQNLPEEAAKRALDAMEMSAAYQKALDNSSAVDEADALPLSARLAQEGLHIETLLLDGFYEVSPAEERFISSLIETAEHTIVTIPVSGVNDDLSYCYSTYLRNYFKVQPLFIPGGNPASATVYHPAPSMEEEIEDIAKTIKGDFISGRRRDLDNTLLVFPRLAPYREMVERVFSRYGIPYTLSSGKCLAATRPCLDLLSLLESVLEDYPRLAFSTFLTSPFFTKIPEKIRDAAPRLCLTSGIIKGRDAWLAQFRREGAYQQAVSLFQTIDAINYPCFKKYYADYVKVLIDVLERLGFQPSEHGKAEFEGILRKLGTLDILVGKKTDFPGFMDALRRVLESEQTRGDGSGVQVAELREARGLEPRMLYMAGLKDGDIPSRPEMDFLLPDAVRRRLGLLDMKRHMHLEEFIFRRLSLAAGGVSMSYPEMEGDKLYLPSIFLSGGTGDRRRPQGIFSREEEMLRQHGKPLAGHMKEIHNIKKIQKHTTLRVTDIDTYRACPRRFFIERILGLSPPEVLDYEIEPMTLGSIVHEVMEKLIPSVPAGLELFREKASNSLDEVLRGRDVDAYFKRLIKETFLLMVPELFEIEKKLQEEGYSLQLAEYELRGEPLEGIKLKGKVDRIDSGHGGAAQVIDYKTGLTTMSSSATLKKGANLQMFLYAALLKTQDRHPSRVGVYSLRDIKLKWFPTKIDRKKSVTLDDFIASSLKFLGVTVSGMRSGDFSAMPIEERTCRSCPERPHCPYIQGAETSFSRVSGRGEGSTNPDERGLEAGDA